MKREIYQKMDEVLRGKTVEEICATPSFMQNLEAYVKVQREERSAARMSEAAIRSLGAGKGLKLPSHPIDATMSWTMDRWRDEYLAVAYKVSNQPAALRKYILQLCNQAYMLTCAQMVVEKFPELEDELIPKKN